MCPDLFPRSYGPQVEGREVDDAVCFHGLDKFGIDWLISYTVRDDINPALTRAFASPR